MRSGVLISPQRQDSIIRRLECFSGADVAKFEIIDDEITIRKRLQ
jgi:hypothetical protein